MRHSGGMARSMSSRERPPSLPRQLIAHDDEQRTAPAQANFAVSLEGLV